MSEPPAKKRPSVSASAKIAAVAVKALFTVQDGAFRKDVEEKYELSQQGVKSSVQFEHVGEKIEMYPVLFSRLDFKQLRNDMVAGRGEALLANIALQGLQRGDDDVLQALQAELCARFGFTSVERKVAKQDFCAIHLSWMAQDTRNALQSGEQQ